MQIKAMITHEHAGRTFLFMNPDIELPANVFFSKIGKASELTEEQCKEMVPEMAFGDRWNNYIRDYPIWFHTAKQSFYSLLQSHSLQPETTLVLEVKK